MASKLFGGTNLSDIARSVKDRGDPSPFDKPGAARPVLPAAELAVVPGTSHGLLAEKPDLCNRLVTDFLTSDPVPTFAPTPASASPRPIRSSCRRLFG